MNFKKLKSAHPGIARLWELLSDVTRPLFKIDPFHDRSEEDDLALQRTGEMLVPELTSGRYDIALSGVFGGHISFRSILKDYRWAR